MRVVCRADERDPNSRAERPRNALRWSTSPSRRPRTCSRRAAASSSTCTRPASRSPRCCRPAASTSSSPSCPFVPGSEVAGVVAAAPTGSGLAAGDRVAAFCMLGGFAETAVAPEFLTFPLPDSLDFAQGAGADPQLPHRLLLAGAARAPDARARPCSCTAPRAAWARPRCRWRRAWARRRSPWCRATRRSRSPARPGADEVVRSDGPWKDQAKELSGGGVDVVLDPVGGDRFTDSLRSLAEGGRWWSWASPAARSPRCRVNRLLLNNTEVVGAGWGAYVMAKPEVNREIGAGGQPAGRGGLRQADRGRALPAGAGGRGARADRRARRHRQGRARAGRGLSGGLPAPSRARTRAGIAPAAAASRAARRPTRRRERDAAATGPGGGASR